MQLQELVIVRRVGERVGPLPAVAHQYLDVLAGAEHQALALGQLQPDAHHVVGESFQARHARRQRPHLRRRAGAGLADAQGQIAARTRLAAQAEALPPFRLVQRRGLRPVRVVDLAGEDLRLAGAALAVATPVRQRHALAQRGVEYGLLGGVEGVPAGAQRYTVHRVALAAQPPLLSRTMRSTTGPISSSKAKLFLPAGTTMVSGRDMKEPESISSR